MFLVAAVFREILTTAVVLLYCTLVHLTQTISPKSIVVMKVVNFSVSTVIVNSIHRHGYLLEAKH